MLSWLLNAAFYFLQDNSMYYYSKIYIYFIVLKCSRGSVVEHCVCSAKVVGSIPREHTYWQKMYNLNAL